MVHASHVLYLRAGFRKCSECVVHGYLLNVALGPAQPRRRAGRRSGGIVVQYCITRQHGICLPLYGWLPPSCCVETGELTRFARARVDSPEGAAAHVLSLSSVDQLLDAHSEPLRFEQVLDRPPCRRAARAAGGASTGSRRSG